jgi:hypothetical protein
MKRTFLFAASALALTFTSPAFADDSASQIVGVWKFVKQQVKEVATGKVSHPYGEKPSGYIIYTKGGRMIFSLVGDDRQKPAGASATDEERIRLFNTLSTGSGTYKVEGNTVIVTYDSSWNQVWTGTTQKRTFVISGNKITHTSAPGKNLAGQETIFENELEKVE